MSKKTNLAKKVDYELLEDERTYIHGHNPTSTRFQKGNVPWNKGKKLKL
jgi:hypothetical protein